MKRIAIIGGGISGLTAAYELELARKRGADIDWHLYEASNRLGGIIETTRHITPEGEWILEGGPDGWISEKPWARELAIELGLESELIYSNDAARKTYIFINGQLQAMPDRMRMFVPEDISTLENSPLFSAAARQAYADELARAAELRASAPDHDESVASFVFRHFGNEVLEKVAAPLLSGVFGGDVHKLSVRSVLAPFVALERDHGSLIVALHGKARERGDRPSQPIFTSLRRGLGSLVDTLTSKLPAERLHVRADVHQISWEEEWYLWLAVDGKPDFPPVNTASASANTKTRPDDFDADEIILATPLRVSRHLLGSVDPVETTLLPSSGSFSSLVPTHASSAVLVAFCWPANAASTFTIPQGFGFLVPQQQSANHSPLEPFSSIRSSADRRKCRFPSGMTTNNGYTAAEGSQITRHSNPVLSTEAKRSGETPVFADASAENEQVTQPLLLAATFTNQKFPRRAPPGARAIRVFFGSDSTDHFANTPDEEVAKQAFAQLQTILGPLPEPDRALTTVRRWPNSLPQYEVGHLDRMALLEELINRIPGLHLLGNSYHGVGLPDLIRDARATARKIADGLENADCLRE